MLIGALQKGDEIPGVLLRVLALQTRERSSMYDWLPKDSLGSFPSFS